MNLKPDTQQHEPQYQQRHQRQYGHHNRDQIRESKEDVESVVVSFFPYLIVQLTIIHVHTVKSPTIIELNVIKSKVNKQINNENLSSCRNLLMSTNPKEIQNKSHKSIMQKQTISLLMKTQIWLVSSLLSTKNQNRRSEDSSFG